MYTIQLYNAVQGRRREKCNANFSVLPPESLIESPKIKHSSWYFRVFGLSTIFWAYFNCNLPFTTVTDF